MTRHKPIFLAAAILLLGLSRVFGVAGTNRISVAVLDFKNLTKNKGYDFLEKTISDSLITTLQKSGNFNLIERQRLAALIDEKKLSLTGLLDQDTAAGKKIGTLLKADNLILGSFSAIGDRIEVNARLVSVDTGEILSAEKISEKMGDKLFTRINELADSMVIRLMDYKAGFLNLDSSPQGAEVKLDNTVLGVTPITELRMRAGNYTVTVVKEGYEIRTLSVGVRENQKNNYNVALERKTEFYPYKILLMIHPLSLLQPDYQPDWSLAFEYHIVDWFSVGVEGGGNLFFHRSLDTNTPGFSFTNTMVLYFHKFNAVAKFHLFPQARFLSPYLGAGLGYFTGSSEEYSLSHSGLYYKGIVGLNIFPASRFSVFIDAIYQNLGGVILNEKRFNLFGNYTYNAQRVSLETILIGLGIRFSF